MPRKIKIISWNLGYWQHREYHEVAWEYLRNVEKPDIGLLQEVRAQDLAEGEDLVFQEIHHGWGTAIYCRGARIVKEIIFSRYPGRVAATEIAIQPGKSLLFASVHAPIIIGRVFPHLDLSILGRKCATFFRQHCASNFRQQCATQSGDANAKCVEF